MGVRGGCFARLWSAKDNGRAVNCYTTVSKKNKDGDGYTQTFNGFVSFFGDACKDLILGLDLPEEFDRNDPVGKTVKIVGSPDVTTWYDKEKKRGGMNVTVYSVELPEDDGGSKPAKKTSTKKETKTKSKSSAHSDDDELPF